MKFKSIIILSALLIFSCSSPQVINQNSETLSSTKISVSDTQKDISGATIPVNISFNDFQTKANSSGTPAKTVADIKSVKLYLIVNSNSNPLLASNIRYASNILSYPANAPSKIYNFFNVPVGTYYVAVELFSDIEATQINNIIEPITYTSAVLGDTAFGMTNGKRGITLSSNYVTITNSGLTFTFSDSSNEFKISPKLLNATGASVGATINATASTDNAVVGPITFQ